MLAMTGISFVQTNERKLSLFTALNNSVVFTQTDENEFRCILTISSRFGADPMGRKKNTLLDTRTGRVRIYGSVRKDISLRLPLQDA